MLIASGGEDGQIVLSVASSGTKVEALQSAKNVLPRFNLFRFHRWTVCSSVRPMSFWRQEWETGQSGFGT